MTSKRVRARSPGTTVLRSTHVGHVATSPVAVLPVAAFLSAVLLLAAPLAARALAAQDEAADEQAAEAPAPADLVVEPASLQLEVGAKAQLTARVLDAAGNPIDRPVMFFSLSRRTVGVTPAGLVEAYRPGEVTIVALVPEDPEEDRPSRRTEALLRETVTVTVPNPPVASVAFEEPPSRFYAGTRVRLDVRVVDAVGTVRSDVPVAFSSTDGSVARVDDLGRLTLLAPGKATVEARAEEATVELELEVEPNPAASLELSFDNPWGSRTGDVYHFSAVPRDAEGDSVPEMPVHYSFSARPDAQEGYGLGIPSAGLIAQDGRFVANLPGEYTIVATSGSLVASETVRIVQRDVRRPLELVGQGAVRDRATSDLWVWEGTDGRDYALTGTWGADGHAYMWDVTDPGNIAMIDTIRVDARTVNDVKVSEDGRVAVISREGASNRRNGLVILDVSEPAEGMKVLARYDDQLTGGVHNVFIHDDHIYALSAGRRYDIINIEDPRNPYRVGRFELDTPGHAIHDVWVEKGVAYSSNWSDGVVAVDVGGGGEGGSPASPVMLGQYAYPSGWNHAAYPYRSVSTGKFYVIAGDETRPQGGFTPGRDKEPERMGGWFHVIEWEDWDSPREVARFEIPDAGAHNLWAEDDILYLAYYNGGLRIVDVSGELMGDLYAQGREIAYFLPYDPEGFRPNAPFVWGPQPYKGLIFFADHNSGLWAVRFAEGGEEGVGADEDGGG